MRCPFCSHEESVVKDSRPTEDGASTRRRRSCPSCGGRFTTFERIQLRELTVVKSDGRRELFDREKVSRSMRVALRKRPVTDEQIERAISGIVRQLESLGDADIPTNQIGALVMSALISLDVVGYVRYASVYKDFRKADDFNAFLEDLKEAQRSLKD
jgi:transcriptional repressor NrdR